jgi:hypothetical protein
MPGIIGILPWKLIHVKYTVIPKTPNYLDSWKEKINDLVLALTACKTAPLGQHFGIMSGFYAKYYGSLDALPDDL